MRLTSGGGAGAAWSPDGTRIAFSANRDGTVDKVFVMNADGSHITALTTELAQAPAWSPDGKKIAFEAARGEPFDQIWAMNADGSGQTKPDQRRCEQLRSRLVAGRQAHRIQQRPGRLELPDLQDEC